MQQHTLGAVIVGCGVIGQAHAEVIAESEGLEVVALVDGRLDVAELLADRIELGSGRRPVTHPDLASALAAEDGAHIVVIATPSGLHVEQAIAALSAGRHVVIEKPVDVDVDRASALAHAAAEARARGLVCTVISQHRFDDGSRVVRHALESGSLGRVTSAIASVPWWRSQGYYDSGTWRGTWALDGGGALMNQGVHTVDLLLWFLGEPVAVTAEYARLAHEGIEVEDTVVATVSFASGALAVVHATTAAYPGLPVRVQVMGSAGSAIVEADELALLTIEDEGFTAPEPLPVPADLGTDWVGHHRQYRDVIDAIREGREASVTVEDAFRALATIRAIYLAATTGTKVAIADVVAGEYRDTEVRLHA